MLAGVYWLGADELKNKKGVSSICPFCKMETEDLQHMVLRCSDNLHIRTKYIPLIQEGFCRIYTQEAWTHCSSSDYNLLKTILDINLMVEHKCTPSHTERRFYTESRFYLESLTRIFYTFYMYTGRYAKGRCIRREQLLKHILYWPLLPFYKHFLYFTAYIFTFMTVCIYIWIHNSDVTMMPCVHPHGWFS